MVSFDYCPRCATTLEDKVEDNRVRRACGKCGYVYYRNPVGAAGIILIEDDELLLVQRKFEPRKGTWTLPAGFMEADEGPAACAVREAHEETNLTVRATHLFGAYSAQDDPRTPVVLLMYLCQRESGDLVPGDDAVAAGFYPLDELPGKIGFEAHRQVVADLRRYLDDEARPMGRLV